MLIKNLVCKDLGFCKENEMEHEHNGKGFKHKDKGFEGKGHGFKGNGKGVQKKNHMSKGDLHGLVHHQQHQHRYEG